MAQEIEVMRVLRTLPTGRMIVEVKGKPVENVSDISDPITRQRLLAAIGELVSFVGGYDVLTEAGLAPPASPKISSTAATPAVPESGQPLPPADDLEKRQAAFLAALENQGAAERTPPTPPSLLNSLRRQRSRELEPPPLSLAEQIDAVLQAKIAAIPQLAGRSIHLRSDPKGGLRIEVDGRYYQRPSEIEDQNIAALIKVAIKEWEKSQ